MTPFAIINVMSIPALNKMIKKKAPNTKPVLSPLSADVGKLFHSWVQKIIRRAGPGEYAWSVLVIRERDNTDFA